MKLIIPILATMQWVAPPEAHAQAARSLVHPTQQEQKKPPDKKDPIGKPAGTPGKAAPAAAKPEPSPKNHEPRDKPDRQAAKKDPAIGKPAGTPGRAIGTVKSISATSLTVRADGKDLTFRIDDKTQIVGTGAGTKAQAKAGKVSTADAVATGDAVSVSYRAQAGTMYAATVRVTAKSQKKD